MEVFVCPRCNSENISPVVSISQATVQESRCNDCGFVGTMLTISEANEHKLEEEKQLEELRESEE